MINLEWHSTLKGVHWFSECELFNNSLEQCWEVWHEEVYQVVKEFVIENKDFYAEAYRHLQ